MLVDARDLDPAEADHLASADVRRVSVEEISADPLPAGPLVLHIDVDVIDGGELAGLRFPVPGGPSTASVLAAGGRVLATGRVVAADIACPWHIGSAEDNKVRANLLTSIARSGLRDWRP